MLADEVEDRFELLVRVGLDVNLGVARCDIDSSSHAFAL